jgi:hypothetical protein
LVGFKFQLHDSMLFNSKAKKWRREIFALFSRLGPWPDALPFVQPPPTPRHKIRRGLADGSGNTHKTDFGGFLPHSWPFPGFFEG